MGRKLLGRIFAGGARRGQAIAAALLRDITTILANEKSTCWACNGDVNGGSRRAGRRVYNLRVLGRIARCG